MAPIAQFVLFEGFDPLDVIAPFEVLAASERIEPELVALGGPGPVVSGTPGLSLTATAALDPSRPGYLLVPGASGPVDDIPQVLSGFAQSDAMPLLRKALDNPEITVAAVCGGSLALAMAGLLEDRNAVTHVLGMPLLEATGTRAVEARVVDDGDFLSCGGVTSGLDLALHLLDRDFGPDVALGVEKLFEYERRGTVWRA
ncbi:DJ-1/PfpI family protein [Lentzea xinjiangensis]|uniref:DJ-1/PfpI family protein n=1 Tax=Lentzea xinjiangensis TaxID=402600 RepID=A0A1H9W2F1_9PSEU|nr:DJ-1/PfpI family protein [Lentzea xinjiangensis]SES28130.1 DJ-1/PfpI family protein [Lentzea xinjiangensis]